MTKMGEMVNRKAGLLFFVFSLCLVGCADEASLTLTYSLDSGTSTPSPDLVVILSAPVGASDSQFKQNIGPVEGQYFYSDPTNLKACALSQTGASGGVTGYIDPATFGATVTADATKCNSLAAYYKNNIFGGSPLGTGQLILPATANAGLKLIDKSNGVIFVLFMWGVTEGANDTIKCFQLFATDIRNQKFVVQSGGSPTPTSSINLVAKYSGGSCFNLK